MVSRLTERKRDNVSRLTEYTPQKSVPFDRGKLPRFTAECGRPSPDNVSRLTERKRRRYPVVSKAQLEECVPFDRMNVSRCVEAFWRPELRENVTRLTERLA